VTTPAGANPFNNLLWNQEAQQVYNAMEAQNDKALAAAWLAFYPSYHAAQPSFSVAQVEQAFLDEELAGGLSTGIAQTGNVLGQVAPAVGAAANTLPNVPAVTNPLDYLKDIGNVFDKLTDPHLWLRVGEFIAGGLLLYLGLKSAMSGTAVASGTRQATSTAKKSHKLVKRVAEVAVIPK